MIINLHDIYQTRFQVNTKILLDTSGPTKTIYVYIYIYIYIYICLDIYIYVYGIK